MNSVKFRTLIGVAFLFLSFSVTAKADGLTFSNVLALQNNGNTSINLFSNPHSNLFGSQLSFFIDIAGTLPASGTDTLRVTFQETGQVAVTQDLPIPFFAGLQLPYTQLLSFTPVHPTVGGTPITFTVDILGSSEDFIIPDGITKGTKVDSYSYTFNAVSPVPEPVTTGFFLLGVSAIIARTRRRS